jgi:hypothetical protein
MPALGRPAEEEEPPMDWSNNHAACVETWYALRVLAQHKKTFDAAGKLTMADLKFFNSASSQGGIALVTRTLAEQLHNLFVGPMGATLEKNVTDAAAKNAMQTKLADDAATMPDLAEAADESYRFLKERT